MIIIAEVMSLFEYIHKNGNFSIENEKQYVIISNILNNSKQKNISVGIPYWVLIEENDEPKEIQGSMIKIEPLCDNDTDCYVFDNIYDAIYGCLHVSKYMYQMHSNSLFYETNYKTISYAISFMENTVTMNNLCEIFKVKTKF
tara:strand:+ start:31536 stop:31964 length:429 start_codon:yes stop_codon:yes gene_type:complete